MFRCFKMFHLKPTVIESIAELELPVRTSLFLMSNLGLIALRIFDLCGLIVKGRGEEENGKRSGEEKREAKEKSWKQLYLQLCNIAFIVSLIA